MSYTNILSNLTKVGEDKEALRKLINVSVADTFKFDQSNDIVDFHKVYNGEKAQFIGDIVKIGKAGAGCSPTYEVAGITNSEKTWSLGSWSVAIKLCYEQIEGSVADYCLKKGTEIGDLTATEFLESIYLPAVVSGLKEFVFRTLFFGDTSAAHVSDGGSITNSVDVNLLKTTDGFFKKFAAIVTADSTRKTTIAANSQSTYATQKSTMLASGTATTLFDNIIMDAPIAVKNDQDAVILCTHGLGEALSHDAKVTYKNNLPWDKLWNGYESTVWNGVRVVRVPYFDMAIKTYEDTGTKLNNPYRAIYTNVKNLAAGSNADGVLSDVSTWFNQDERMQKLYAAGKMGVLVLEDDKIQVAY